MRKCKEKINERRTDDDAQKEYRKIIPGEQSRLQDKKVEELTMQNELLDLMRSQQEEGTNKYNPFLFKRIGKLVQGDQMMGDYDTRP